MTDKDEIRDHIEVQPYAIKCSNCDAVLECDVVEVDSDLDLKLTIYPCQTCIDDGHRHAGY